MMNFRVKIMRFVSVFREFHSADIAYMANKQTQQQHSAYMSEVIRLGKTKSESSTSIQIESMITTTTKPLTFYPRLCNELLRFFEKSCNK